MKIHILKRVKNTLLGGPKSYEISLCGLTASFNTFSRGLKQATCASCIRIQKSAKYKIERAK
jgi:hypothetical protein